MAKGPSVDPWASIAVELRALIANTGSYRELCEAIEEARAADAQTIRRLEASATALGAAWRQTAKERNDLQAAHHALSDRIPYADEYDTMAREVADLRARLAAVTQELDALKAVPAVQWLLIACRTCQQPQYRHCDFDEPGFDHPGSCALLHHEFRPAEQP